MGVKTYTNRHLCKNSGLQIFSYVMASITMLRKNGKIWTFDAQNAILSNFNDI